MKIMNYSKVYSIIIFIIFSLSFNNAQSKDVYKYFSKVFIKVEGKNKFETIVAYNEFYDLNPKVAKFKLPFNDEICIGKMVLRHQSSFKFMCSSGYSANGVYYPTINAVDAFGKGIDSNGNKLIFRLEGANNSLKNDYKNILRMLISSDQKKQRINSDNQEPIIDVFTKYNGSIVIISVSVTDDTEVAEVLVDGQVQELKFNGTFETNFYVPRSGKTIEIVAFDVKGNKALKVLKLERDNIQQASGPFFKALNPSIKRVKPNPNALALIIGVANYEKTPANALYADKDAQQFYDYATMKLGISSSNIKELVNEKADLGEILINVKDWLRRSAKPNKSDIYLYFAGHGLSSQDGTKMYLLPYDGRPRLLENTALLRDELFKDIKQANPHSVTVFLDTCYSGVTGNEEMLIAGRPIVIKAKEQAIPDGFTLFSQHQMSRYHVH